MRLFFAENLFANECAVCALVTRLCAAVFNYVRFTVGNRRNAISISDIMAIGTICAWIKTNGNLRDSHRCVSIPVTCIWNFDKNTELCVNREWFRLMWRAFALFYASDEENDVIEFIPVEKICSVNEPVAVKCFWADCSRFRCCC